MDYTIIHNDQQSYIECLPGMKPVASEQDALDLVALCGELEIHHLMLHAEHFNDDFYDLKSGLAGQILLKFTNYYLKVAAVIPPERIGQGRFYEMALESRRSRDFAIFHTRPEAERWLLRE